MIKINLVPQDILFQEQQQLRKLQGGAVAAGAALVVVLISGVQWYRVNRLETRQHEVEKEYKDKWADIGAKLEAKKAAADALRTRLNVITDLLKGRPLYPHFMVDLSRS